MSRNGRIGEAGMQPSKEDLLQLSHACHGTLRSRVVASRAVNLSEQLLGVQRVSLLIKNGKSCRLVAVSGAGTISSRSRASQLMRRGVGRALALDRFIRYPSTEPEEELPPQVEEVFQQYVDVAGVASLLMFPIRAPRGGLLGAIVVESFQENIDQAQIGDSIQPMLPIVGSALENALWHEMTPLAWATRLTTSWGRTTRGLIALFAVIIILGLGLSYVSVPASVIASGYLVPEERTGIFVPEDAIVEECAVEDQQRVNSGQLLLALHSPDLSLKRDEVLASIDASRQELIAVKAERSARTRGRPTAATVEQSANHEQELAGKEMLTQLKIRHDEKRLESINMRLSQLAIDAPSAAVVSMSDDSTMWEGKPVRRGEKVMELYDSDSPWVALLRIPNDQINRFLCAESNANASNESLRVNIGLAVSETMPVRGTISDIGNQVHFDQALNQFVLQARVRLTRESMKSLNPTPDQPPRVGLTVKAEVIIGRESLGSWLFRDWVTWLTDQYRFRISPIRSPANE